MVKKLILRWKRKGGGNQIIDVRQGGVWGGKGRGGGERALKTKINEKKDKKLLRGALLKGGRISADQSKKGGSKLLQLLPCIRGERNGE